MIVSSRKANLGLREIEELLALYKSGGGAEAQLSRGVELLRSRLRDLEQEYVQIAQLATALEQKLRDVTTPAPGASKPSKPAADSRS